jgi:hypothetical protein
MRTICCVNTQHFHIFLARLRSEGFVSPEMHSNYVHCCKMCVKIVYFVNRASHYKFLVITNLTHFMYLFISCLYMFRTSQCSSSGDRIVLIHHLVGLVCVSDCLVCRFLLTGIPSSHSHRLILPDDVFIQFDLLMMSAVTLETCRDVKDRKSVV